MKQLINFTDQEKITAFNTVHGIIYRHFNGLINSDNEPDILDSVETLENISIIALKLNKKEHNELDKALKQTYENQ